VQDTSAQFLRLVAIITRLRAPDGCPWDRKQTPQTFKGYLLEETHELLEAINHHDVAHVREELGDMLFQIVFLANLYAEAGHFTLADVIDAIAAKMVRRHPHVFGDRIIGSEQELRQQWHAIKAAEKGETTTPPRSPLESIPQSLPALLRAQRVADRAARTGFDWPDAASAFTKVEEEVQELKRTLADGDGQRIGEELGDLLFSLTVLARKTGTDSEEALQGATTKFIRRFSRLEQEITRDGGQLADLAPATLLRLWQATKTPE